VQPVAQTTPLAAVHDAVVSKPVLPRSWLDPPDPAVTVNAIVVLWLSVPDVPVIVTVVVPVVAVLSPWTIANRGLGGKGHFRPIASSHLFLLQLLEMQTHVPDERVTGGHSMSARFASKSVDFDSTHHGASPASRHALMHAGRAFAADDSSKPI